LASRDIWVFPELNGPADEVEKLSLGLLTEARYIADKAGGSVTAIVCNDNGETYTDILSKFGADQVLVFKHARFKIPSAEAAAPALIAQLQKNPPWLFLAGHTTISKELLPLLAVALKTGIVSNCVKMDLDNLDYVKLYRPTLGEQVYQEIVFQTPGTMLVTMDPNVLNVAPLKDRISPQIAVIEQDLENVKLRIQHLAYQPADFQTIDVEDAEVIVSAGTGAVSAELLPLVRELASLLEGSIGATRPVVDDRAISRERMIGQTGKTVSPDLYLALGISGAAHHVGGIQESGAIVSINRDPQAPIFQSSDIGVVADLKEVLPKLIEKIKKAKIE
jgi:electron transfer flavoprotein alpha subunit